MRERDIYCHNIQYKDPSEIRGMPRAILLAAPLGLKSKDERNRVSTFISKYLHLDMLKAQRTPDHVTDRYFLLRGCGLRE